MSSSAFALLWLFSPSRGVRKLSIAVLEHGIVPPTRKRTRAHQIFPLLSTGVLRLRSPTHVLITSFTASLFISSSSQVCRTPRMRVSVDRDKAWSIVIYTMRSIPDSADREQIRNSASSTSYESSRNCNMPPEQPAPGDAAVVVCCAVHPPRTWQTRSLDSEIDLPKDVTDVLPPNSTVPDFP